MLPYFANILVCEVHVFFWEGRGVNFHLILAKNMKWAKNSIKYYYTSVLHLFFSACPERMSAPHE